VILEAFIASQLIGARREAVEARARERYTYEDDLVYAKVIGFILFAALAPFLWPIGVFYNTDINKRKYLYYPLYAAGIFISLGSFVFYYTVGVLWAVYTLLTLKKFVARYEKKKRKKMDETFEEEKEIVYDGEADVIVEMTVCECGCGEQAKKFTLKPR
jgi:hypothetical protein